MSRPRTVVIVGAGLAAKAAETLFVHEDFYEEHAIDLRLGERVLLPAATRDA
jgi:hypothetical protein